MSLLHHAPDGVTFDETFPPALSFDERAELAAWYAMHEAKLIDSELDRMFAEEMERREQSLWVDAVCVCGAALLVLPGSAAPHFCPACSRERAA